MKNKILKFSAFCLVALAIFSTMGTDKIIGRLIIPDPGPTYLTWVLRPSDTTVNTGTPVTLTWKAKTSFSSRTFTIYKNDAYVKGSSWSSNVAFSYTYTPTLSGKDTIKCIIKDSKKTYTDYCTVTINQPIKFTATPKDKTVLPGSTVTLTWKAISSYPSKTYKIYKNGVKDQYGSWSSSISYTYTTSSSEGDDTIKCRIYDSQTAINDFCTITKHSGDTDRDGISNAKEISLGTDPNNKYDPLGQHFETQSVGSNPSDWIVQEYSGYSDVGVLLSSSCGLSNAKPGNLLRLLQIKQGSAPSIMDYVSYSLTSPKLISFEVGFNDPYDGVYTKGYLNILSNNAGHILKLEFEHDQVTVWETSTSSKNLDISFKEKQMYKYDIILENDGSGYVDYSIYIDGQLATYDTIAKNSAIGVLEFGVDGGESTDMYLDNIYHGNVDVGNVDNNVPVNYASVICWVFAPEVDGVLSTYQVGRTESTTWTLSVELAAKAKVVSVRAGLKVATLYKKVTDTYYGVALAKGNSDVIVHLTHDFTISKKEIKLPGSSAVYLDVLIDLDYINSYYDDLTETEFQAKFDWAPTNPTKSFSTKGPLVDVPDGGDGEITKIGSHEKTYPESDTGYILEYKKSKTFTTYSSYQGVKIGKGIYIGVTRSFTKAVYAETWLYINRDISPHFDYGTAGYTALLNIKPYVVKALGTM